MISRKIKKRFWQEVKQVRNGEQARDEMVMDLDVQILRDGVEVSLVEYFEQVLIVEDAREANTNPVGDRRMSVLGELNGRAISIEEIKEAVMAPGLDRFPVEYLKKCVAVLERLVRLLNVSFDMGTRW